MKNTKKKKKVFDNKALTSILSDSSLKEHSNIRIGDKASYLFTPQSVSDLALIINDTKKAGLDFLPVGGGSNILFGYVGDRVVILDRDLPKICEVNNNRVVVSSNHDINSFLSEMIKYELGGLEFLAGIPAHLGGTVNMNAGAFGKNISDYLDWVEIINPEGKEEIIRKEALKFDYRHSSIDGFITKIAFNLEEKTRETISSEIQSILAERRKRHPYDFPSLGSTFKNPPGYFAGKLVEECGLKGSRIGDAEISEKHGNFILNKGNATFEDVMGLIDLVRKEVYERKGIQLELEIKVIN
ncbi:MAG: UDP-N-acetylmuramate dehydrogenase [Candidatus Cloacimonetes bacterium]|nr:UDP-N-acetylmuramate dehydrogenase [Candidatus Cloacimonadota bacterium]